MNKKIMKQINKINVKVLLGVIIGVQLLFMLFYCNMKKGYFVDELWSYGLSNSYYHAQIWEDEGLSKTEIGGEMFHDYITVQPGQEFSFGSVFYNQSHDVHPPLFYVVLHAVSSCFPNQFSKWFALIPNLLYFAVTILFLYKIAVILSKNKYFPFIVILFYGFSIAAVNTVIYIRMYMMLTMWAVLFAYFHLKTLRNSQIKKRDLLLLFVSVCGGIYTQYMFAVFAVPWVVSMLVYLLKRKNSKDVILYMITGVAGLLPLFVLFPKGVAKILNISSGEVSTLRINDTFDSWKNNIPTYFGIIGRDMFGKSIGLFFAIILIGMIVCFVNKYLVNVQVIKENESYALKVSKVKSDYVCYYNLDYRTSGTAIVLLTIVFFFLFTTKKSPYISNRYVMILYPFIALVFCKAVWMILSEIQVLKKRRLPLAVLCILFVGLFTYYAGDPEYIYSEKSAGVEMSEKYADLPCVYVYTTAYIMIDNALELENFDSIYQMYYESIDKDMAKMSDYDRGIILYVDRIMKDDGTARRNGITMSDVECVNKISKITGLENIEYVYGDDKVLTYHLY